MSKSDENGNVKRFHIHVSVPCSSFNSRTCSAEVTENGSIQLEKDRGIGASSESHIF